ncbi:MAG: hypothetical protein NT159_00070 [Proteobacteria bacterium]|nr:hypothetical protein [Pseudomonadota bacterium]
MASIELRLVPAVFDAEKPAPPLAVAFVRPKPSAEELAATRRPEKGASPVAPHAALLSTQPQPSDLTDVNSLAPPPTTGSLQFDLDALRQQARDLERRGRKAPLVAPRNLGQSLPTPILESDTPLTRPIAQAKRPACGTKYAGAGLFAIPLLLYDTATDKGCQW